MKLRTRETVEKGRLEGGREGSTGGNNREGGSGNGRGRGEGGWRSGSGGRGVWRLDRSYNIA